MGQPLDITYKIGNVKIKILWGKVTTKKPVSATRFEGIQLQTVTVSEFGCSTSDFSLNGPVEFNQWKDKADRIHYNLSLIGVISLPAISMVLLLENNIHANS